MRQVQAMHSALRRVKTSRKTFRKTQKDFGEKKKKEKERKSDLKTDLKSFKSCASPAELSAPGKGGQNPTAPESKDVGWSL